MGAFYNSICIPGDEHLTVRGSLERWLGGRGFTLRDRPLLFDLDGENERCAFVVWNDRWTVVFFSKYEEERRLIRELQTWAADLLYVWVQDSDVWGYDTFDANGFTGSFNSDPRAYRSFVDAADGTGRPMAEPGEVCRRFAPAEQAEELARIQRSKAIFKEDVCLQLCRLVGAEPALTSYDDLERGAYEELDGWHVDQLLFIHRDAADEDSACDLHEHRLDADAAERQSSQIEIPPEVLAEMKRRRQVWQRWLLLRPMSWLARGWRTAYEAPARARRGTTPPRRRAIGASGISRHESSAVIEVRHLINERHRCRIRLAVGGETKSGSSKPAAVFAFQIGDTSVTCTARRRSMIAEVLRPPGRSKVLHDESYLIVGLSARHLLFELPPGYVAGTSAPSYLGLHVVQTEQALYVFLYRFASQVVKEVERAIGSTVRSFRLLD